MKKLLLIALALCALVAAQLQANSITSPAFAVDTISIGTEFTLQTTDEIVFDNEWEGGVSSEIVAIDVNENPVDTILENGTSGMGDVNWNYTANPNLPKNGDYKLVYTTYDGEGNPVGNSVETAYLHITPEPSVLVLLALAGLFVGRSRK